MPIARELKAQRSEAALLRDLGDVGMQNGELPVALGYYQQRLKSRREIGDKRRIAESLNRLAQPEEQRGGSEAL